MSHDITPGCHRCAMPMSPRSPRRVLRTGRRLARLIPFHRVFHSVELSILVPLAAIVDLFVGGMATMVLLAALVVAACLTLIGHLDRGADLLEAAVTTPSAPQVRGRRPDDGQTAG